MSFRKKCFLYYSVLMALLLLIAGCSNNFRNELQEGQALKLKFIINNQSSQIIEQSVSDHIILDKFLINVSKGDVTYNKEVNALETSEVIFNNLESGLWKVNVVAIDTEGYQCYAGSTDTMVIDGVTTATVDLFLLQGNLNLIVKIPNFEGTSHVTSGNVKLVNPRSGEEHIDKSLNMVGMEGIVYFGDVLAGTYYLEVDLFESDGSKIAWGSAIVTVFPGRNNHGIVEFDLQNLQGGQLRIIINLNLSPSDPTGVTASIINGNAVVSWNPNPESNIIGYTVYRAQSENGFKKILTYKMISETSYIDTDNILGETYYYWVQAYNSDGYSSELSEPFVLTGLPVFPDLDQFNNVIYVDALNGSDQNGNGEDDNPYKTLGYAISKINSSFTAVYLKNTGDYTISSLGTLFDANGFTHVSYIGEQSNIILERRVTRDTDVRYISFYKLIFTIAPNFSSNWSVFDIYTKSPIIRFRFYNCVFRDPYEKIVYSDTGGVFVFDNNSNTNPNYERGWSSFINCSFDFTKPKIYRYLNGSYGNNISFINSSMSRSTIGDNGAHVVNTIYSVIFNESYHIINKEWVNIGTGLNPDGTIANIGVYGGEYAWGLW